MSCQPYAFRGHYIYLIYVREMGHCARCKKKKVVGVMVNWEDRLSKNIQIQIQIL